MTLTAELEVTRGDFTLDARLTVSRGETLALLGPNGSGKSTMLATIAGLLIPQRGRIVVGGRVLTDIGGRERRNTRGSGLRDTGGRDMRNAHGRRRTNADVGSRRIQIPPHRRRIGLLGQDPLLFPHLSALENIAFGAGARGHANRLLEDMGLAGFGARKPAELSGGQQQRVAIARALAAEPEVLLLDEPMAALDVETAALIRSLLRERLAAANIATVVVTHDVVDALVLADRVAILDCGRIVDIGDPAEVVGRPVSRFAAALAGLNLVEGVLEGGNLIRTPDGRSLRADNSAGRAARATGSARAARATGSARAARATGSARAASATLAEGEAATPPRVGDAVTAVFPPSAVWITQARVTSGGGPSWPATVARLEPAAGAVRVTFAGIDVAAECAAAELLAAGIREGTNVSVTVDPAFVTVYRTRRPTVGMG